MLWHHQDVLQVKLQLETLSGANMKSRENSNRILIVEDQIADLIINYESVKHLWPDSTIDQADTMELAYSYLRGHQYDLILLDLNLDHSHGPATVKEIRKIERHAPIVVVTNMINDMTVRACLEAGANHVASKDYVLDEVFREILTENIKTTS